MQMKNKAKKENILHKFASTQTDYTKMNDIVDMDNTISESVNVRRKVESVG